MSRIKYQTIMTVKESPKATVVLADVEGMDEPVIIKHLYHANVEIFQELSALNNSHIPKIYEIEKREEELIIAEEYVDGETLEVLLQRGMLGEEQKLELALQLCEAVEALHDCQPPVIHRDIKPSNILVTKQGILKLIDFDASRQYKEEDKNSDTMLLGTAEYAAPEQFGYSQTDVRSDIYSMGVVFNEMNLRKKNYAERAWKRVVDTCTSFDPKNRYKNVTLLKQEIEKVKKGRKSFLVLWCSLATVVIVFGAGIVWWTNREPAEGLTLTPTVTLELTKELSSTPSPVLSEAPSLTLSPVPSEALSSTPSPVPSEEPSSTPSPVPPEAPSPTPSPVLSEEPSSTPSPVPPEEPSSTPSPVPPEEPSPTPSPVPSEEPSSTPSPVPPEEPSSTPSPVPPEEPSSTPSPIPTEEPTPIPSPVPTVPSTVYQNVYWRRKVEYQMEKYQGLELCLPVEHKGKAVVYLCLADENDRFAEELVLLEEQWYQNLPDGSGIRLEEELFVQYGNQGALSLYVDFFDGMGERVQIIYGGEAQ